MRSTYVLQLQGETGSPISAVVANMPEEGLSGVSLIEPEKSPPYKENWAGRRSPLLVFSKMDTLNHSSAWLLTWCLEWGR